MYKFKNILYNIIVKLLIIVTIVLISGFAIAVEVFL